MSNNRNVLSLLHVQYARSSGVNQTANSDKCVSVGLFLIFIDPGNVFPSELFDYKMGVYASTHIQSMIYTHAVNISVYIIL